jgi:hypothetical protein
VRPAPARSGDERLSLEVVVVVGVIDVVGVS